MAGADRLTPDPHDAVFFEGDTLKIVDQTLLPTRFEILALHSPEETADAIKRLAVRGAMAIGVAGAYGVLLGALEGGRDAGLAREGARRALAVIAASRPTARNLFWALERMEAALQQGESDNLPAMRTRLRETADAVALDTMETNRRLVEAGQEVLPPGSHVLTHCNSGPLAALRYGTGLGVLIEAHRLGKQVHVFVDETRPLLQGARLTAWELAREGVPYTLLPDGAAGYLMQQGRVDLVITGADRIAMNGDTANKIGTYAIAALAKVHGVPFFIAAPGSTVDGACPAGDSIVIEERDPDEVRTFAGRTVAPADAPVYNPSFDVTPAALIHGIITELGVLRPPFDESLRVFHNQIKH